MHEYNQGNAFVTLTYRPKDDATATELRNKQHIPDDWSLHKDHFQKFIKRLRKAHPNQKIKYYHAGEYGDICRHGLTLSKSPCPLCNLGRPHYHSCIFNYRPKDLTEYARDGETIRRTSESLTKIWGNGFVDVGDLTLESAAYTARYIMKKVTGVNAPDHYQNVSDQGEIINVTPEYSTMSNGIGSEWYSKHRNDLWPSDEMPLVGQGKVIKKVPRYYEEKLKKEDPELHDDIKERRLNYRNDNSAEYSSERLYAKYKVKKAQTTGLLNRG